MVSRLRSASSIFGGPDAFLLYQLGIAASAEYQLTALIDGILNLRLIDNFDKFTYTARATCRASALSNVNTVTSNSVDIARRPDHARRPVVGQPVLQRVRRRAGKHVAGAGAEWLYRPWRSPVGSGR